MTLAFRALTDEEQGKIERLMWAQSAPMRRRARIIWLAAQGLTTSAIAQWLGVSEKAVRQRVKRFEVEGMVIGGAAKNRPLNKRLRSS
jgi:transposase